MLTLISSNDTPAKPDEWRPIQGRHYMAVDVPSFEYLTIGETYVCTLAGRNLIGLHRPSDGAGTYVHAARVKSGQIVLSEVRSDG